MRIRLASLLILVTACGDSFTATTGNVRYTASSGESGESAGLARIKTSTDTLPIRVTIEVDVQLQNQDDGSYQAPASVDVFELRTASGAPCTVTTPGSCVGTKCSGAFELGSFGVCLLGIHMEAPEGKGSECWEYSVVDAVSVGDAAYHTAFDAAQAACLDQF